MAARIEDYALLSDCRSAALVDRHGSLDWMCMPRFDSAAMCAALLGGAEHGQWRMVPQDRIVSSRRRYRPGTMVLETDLEMETGSVRLTDFMPPQTRDADVFRIVECTRGE